MSLMLEKKDSDTVSMNGRGSSSLLSMSRDDGIRVCIIVSSWFAFASCSPTFSSVDVSGCFSISSGEVLSVDLTLVSGSWRDFTY